MNQFNKNKPTEEDVLFQMAAAHMHSGPQPRAEYPGTSFAGIEKVCNYSLTPNPRSSEQLHKLRTDCKNGGGLY